MKTSKFTVSQIMAILKQPEAGSPVPELCGEHGMSSAAFKNGEPNSAARMRH